MSSRQNSIFNFIPNRVTSRSKSVVETTPKTNKISHYSKIMYIDGIKNGDIKQFQKNALASCKSNNEQKNLSLKFQNQLLNFLMISVKDQYKDSYKKKQNKNYYKRAQISTHKKAASFTDANQRSQSQKKSKMQDIFYVQKKQIVEEISANYLKNKKLLNLKVGKNQKQLDVNCVLNRKQFMKYKSSCNTETKQKQEAKISSSSKVDQFAEDNQDVYLKSHVGQRVSNNAQSQKARIKTEQFDSYLSDQFVKQYMSIQNKNDKERPFLKSQDVRVLSALQLLSNKKDARKTYYFRGRSYNKNKASIYQEHMLLTKSVFEGNSVLRNVNHSYNLITSQKTPVYNRKKPVTRNRRSYNNPSVIDNFLITNKRK